MDRSEHMTAHPYYLYGIADERERIIALLAEPSWHRITFWDTHDEECPTCHTIAVIKGETK